MKFVGKYIAGFIFSALATAHADCTLKITTDSPIGPGTFDYLERAISHAEAKNCSSILYLINTPGGSLQSTRLIVEKILNSPVPFLCLVYPAGGHAGSAGAIILQACHVNGAVETTNVGAATPVSMGGEMTDDLRNKAINDTVSLLDGLVDLRGRNKDFARESVTKAKAVDAKEALRLRAIDIVPKDIDEYLKSAAGRSVRLSKGASTKVQTGNIEAFDPDLRFAFLDLVTHPQVAYLIFMASLALLYFEITHAGMIAPGVFGAVGLVISLMSFHMLNVQWGGIALIFLGIAFMVGELFVTSFGILGVGGIASFVAGSLLLFDPETGRLPLGLILPAAIGLGIALMGLGVLALSTRKIKVKNTSLVGEFAKVTQLSSAHVGKVEIHGEIWNFESTDSIVLSEKVKIQEVIGLKLIVRRT